jgi:hypothetical protein
MEHAIPSGTTRAIDGRWRIHYDGYWIKIYKAPADTLLAKKKLIEALTRRLFNHCEHGINIPGTRLEEARKAFAAETDPPKLRVKGAMLAGALFNRATDVFTKVVEIQALGIEIRTDNDLMRQCGDYLQEALQLGTMVLHRSGEEGIDELWGEPFKAFAFPIEEFYKTRYLKIAMTMRAIDDIQGELVLAFRDVPMFAGVEPLIQEFARAAKVRSETLNTDADIFDIWTKFVVAGEQLTSFEPTLDAKRTAADRQRAQDGLQLIHDGKNLVSFITRARVPMPKSTRAFVERCQSFGRGAAALDRVAVAAGDERVLVDETVNAHAVPPLNAPVAELR